MLERSERERGEEMECSRLIVAFVAGAATTAAVFFIIRRSNSLSEVLVPDNLKKDEDTTALLKALTR